MGADPVRFGLVASLNRSGGKFTGVSYLANTILERQIGMLHESISRAAAIGFLVNPSNPNAEHDMIGAAAASRASKRRQQACLRENGQVTNSVRVHQP